MINETAMPMAPTNKLVSTRLQGQRRRFWQAQDSRSDSHTHHSNEEYRPMAAPSKRLGMETALPGCRCRHDPVSEANQSRYSHK